MEQGFSVDSNTIQISNLENATNGIEYRITRNNNNDLIITEITPQIEGLENIQNDDRYQITRNNNDRVEVIENNNREIPQPITGDLPYGIRRNNNNFSLTRIGAFNEFVFASNNATIGEEFNIIGENGSRVAYVFTASCKIIKFGLIHVSNFRTTGLINDTYSFEFIINNRNRTAFELTLDNSEGTDRARVMDVEDLNNFVSARDSMGLRFVSGLAGNYMEARVLVDFNNRSTTAIGGFNSETIQ